MWNVIGLSKVASRVGKPICSDEVTATKVRPFARVLVEIGLHKDMIDTIKISVDGMIFEQPVIYEWIPLFCS